jgi:hypothetical protein
VSALLGSALPQIESGAARPDGDEGETAAASEANDDDEFHSLSEDSDAESDTGFLAGVSFTENDARAYLSRGCD